MISLCIVVASIYLVSAIVVIVLFVTAPHIEEFTDAEERRLRKIQLARKDENGESDFFSDLSA
jgi:hypothetical protein